MEIFEQYELFIYYNELRDNNGNLIMYVGSSFDTIKKDDTTGFIVLSNTNNEDICMLNSNLHISSINHIDNNRDKIRLTDGNFYVNIFCKKK